MKIKKELSINNPLDNFRIIVLLGIAVLILGMSLIIGYIPYQIDDAFIVYRYADNLANNQGFTFNPGSTPVEGFTSPFWVFLIYLGHIFFGKDFIVNYSIILGILVFLSLLVAVFMGVKTDNKRSYWQSLIGITLFSVLPAITFYSVSGLETILFLLIVITFASTVNKSFKFYIGMIAGIFSIWVRPEAAWLPVMLFFQVFGEGEVKKIFSKNYLKLIFPIVISGLVLISIRLIIFNEIFPNTYYAKKPVLLNGLFYAKNVFLSEWGGAILILAIFGALIGSKKHRGYLFAGLSWVIAAIVEGGDWMPVARLMIPALALFALAATGIASYEFKRNKKDLIIVVVSLIFLITLFVNIKASIEYGVMTNKSTKANVHLEKTLSRWVVQSNASSICSVDIGVLGFETGIEIVDVVGLTDSYVSKTPGFHLDKKFDLDYIFSKRKPDLIIFRLSKPPTINQNGMLLRCNPKSKIEKRILLDNRLIRDYKFIFGIIPGYLKGEDYYGKLIFGRKDFFIPRELIPANGVMKFKPLN